MRKSGLAIKAFELLFCTQVSALNAIYATPSFIQAALGSFSVLKHLEARLNAADSPRGRLVRHRVHHRAPRSTHTCLRMAYRRVQGSPTSGLFSHG